MIGSFSFNGVDSSSFKLVCKSVKRSLLPAVKTRRIELPGMSGAYDLDINGVDYEYDLRTVTMKIQYIGTSYQELRTRARTIAAWLSSQSWCRLIINDETDKYYLAKVTKDIDLESLWESGSADIEFDCQPFAYGVTEQIITYTNKSSIDELFTNPGTRTINYKSPQGSRFHIQVVGTWATLAVAMNGAVIQYSEAGSGTLTIDNIEMEVYLNNVNKLSVVTGSYDTFLKVIPGVNEFVLSGIGVNVTVTLRYIPLWL